MLTLLLLKKKKKSPAYLTKINLLDNLVIEKLS